MNYTLIRQREVQQGFFSHHQATLFTIHLTIGKEQRNLAIISNYMEHTTAFVHCALCTKNSRPIDQEKLSIGKKRSIM